MKHTQLLASLVAFAASNAWCAQVNLQNSTATYSQADYGGFVVSQAIDGILTSDLNGWAIARPPNYNYGATATQAETAVFETSENFGTSAGTSLTFSMYFFHSNPGHNLGNFRLSVTADDRSTFADSLSTGGDVTANWTVLNPLSATSTGGAILGISPDGSILASGPNPATSIYTITAETFLAGITGFRLEALDNPSLPFTGPGRFPNNGNFILDEFVIDAQPVPVPGALSLFAVGLAFIARQAMAKAKMPQRLASRNSLGAFQRRDA